MGVLLKMAQFLQNWQSDEKYDGSKTDDGIWGTTPYIYFQTNADVSKA
jgi:hypothetical protein